MNAANIINNFSEDKKNVAIFSIIVVVLLKIVHRSSLLDFFLISEIKLSPQKKEFFLCSIIYVCHFLGGIQFLGEYWIEKKTTIVFVSYESVFSNGFPFNPYM